MISVIIPLFNAENSIGKALVSIANQTWKGDFEIIIVNDGSTDNSKSVVENYIQNNPSSSILIINQENGGVSNSRNTALKIATGDYIAFLDADDEWYPQKTERQIEIFENNKIDIDFLSCRRKFHKILFPYRSNKDQLASISFRKLMFRNEVHPSTVIFNREILENTGYFDCDQRYAEDVNYWLKISKRNKMYILNEELIVAGDGKRTFGKSGLSANLPEMEKGFQKNLSEMLKLKRINTIDYGVYFIFYKLKFILRISRNLLLNLQGK